MPAHLLRADKVVTLDAHDTIINDGYLVIENGQIVEFGAQSALGNRHFDQEFTLRSRLVMPGLVNAHTHTPMSLFRGHAEGHSLFTIEGWYNAIRVLEQKLEPEMLPPAVAVSCAEMIRTGTTCFADQYFWSDQIVPQVRKSGLRASVAYGIVELGDDTARSREIAAATAFLETLRDDPLIDGWLGPHAFFVDNTEDAMVQEMALADRFDTGMHIHLATDTSEDDYCQEKYGRTAIQQMHEMGVLDRRIIAAHAITVHNEDLRLLVGKPFTIVVAASSAMRNAAGTAPLRAMVEAGVNTALGTDNVTNNNSYDMFKEMQIAAKVNTLRELTPNAVATRAILDMATMGGARAMGLEDQIGSIEVGKRADLISLDLDEIGWAPFGGQDVYTALVYSVCGLHVRDVMVDGRWLFRDNRFTTLDYRTECQALEKQHTELARRISQ